MAQYPRGKAWWSASRTMQDQPRAPHGGQPVEQPRATADTTCGSIIEARPRFPTPKCTTVPSLTTYPSRNRGRGQQGLQHFPGREPASSSSYRFRGERLPDSSQTLTISCSKGKASARPMVVSQWGLDSKNSGCKTSPGHPMVDSQWSNPELEPTQITVPKLEDRPRVPNTQAHNCAQPGHISK